MNALGYGAVRGAERRCRTAEWRNRADSGPRNTRPTAMRAGTPCFVFNCSKLYQFIKTRYIFFMENQFSRTERLLGFRALEKIRRAHIVVFGVGGVGSYTIEALARSGVGFFTIVDSDVVSITNINRQIIATHKTLGRSKVSVMKERILEINPDAVVCDEECFFLPETADRFDFSKFDYVVDAVDTVSAKIEIILRAKAFSVPVISSMGAGNKLDPSQFCIADIYETSVCPLARVMRQELRKKGVQGVKVVFSTEKPVAVFYDDAESEAGEKTARRSVPGSVAYVPSVAGLMIASEVIKDIAGL